MPAASPLVVSIRAVSVGNPIEDTPEGMHAMDLLRIAERDERAEFTMRFGERALALRDEAAKRLERRVLLGDPA